MKNFDIKQYVFEKRVDFGELSSETAIIRYMSMMNDVQKQAACASQILLRGNDLCEH